MRKSGKIETWFLKPQFFLLNLECSNTKKRDPCYLFLPLKSYSEINPNIGIKISENYSPSPHLIFQRPLKVE